MATVTGSAGSPGAIAVLESAAPASSWSSRGIPLLGRLTAIGFSVVLVTLAGCAAGVMLEPPGIDHPANPGAAVAPVSPIPDTLATEAVPAPEQGMDPHAGHYQHMQQPQQAVEPPMQEMDPHAGHRQPMPQPQQAVEPPMQEMDPHAGHRQPMPQPQQAVEPPMQEMDPHAGHRQPMPQPAVEQPMQEMDPHAGHRQPMPQPQQAVEPPTQQMDPHAGHRQHRQH